MHGFHGTKQEQITNATKAAQWGLNLCEVLDAVRTLHHWQADLPKSIASFTSSKASNAVSSNDTHCIYMYEDDYKIGRR